MVYLFMNWCKPQTENSLRKVNVFVLSAKHRNKEWHKPISNKFNVGNENSRAQGIKLERELFETLIKLIGYILGFISVFQ